MRSASWSVAALALAPFARAQAPAHTWIDDAARLGPSSVAPAGDWNGDGFPDLFVGGFYASKVVVLSGVDRTPLQTIATQSTLYAIDELDDVDGDGVHDVLVGEPYDDAGGSLRGAARVYSGSSGALLHEFLGAVDEAHFGVAVRNVSDVDADGVDDVAAISIASPAPARAEVHSGRTGALLHAFTGNALAIALDGLGDVDGDGHADLLRTDPDELLSPTSHGRARVLSGRTGLVIHDIVGLPGEMNFGSVHARAGDLDGDGVGDFVLGAWSSPLASGVRAYSGSTGMSLFSMAMGNLGPTPLFVHDVFAIGDANGDGAPDLALRSASHVVDVVSGVNGSLLYRVATPVDAWDIASATDLDRDGLSDLVLVGWLGGYYGYFGLYSYSSGWPEAVTYCAAKINSAGCTPRIAHTSGGTSLSVGDELEVRAFEVLSQTNGLLVWSTANASLPFHGGTLCVAPSAGLVRTPVRSSGTSPTACSGTFRYVFRRSYFAAHLVTPGTTIYAQFVSRDPGFAPPNAFGLTDALAITLAP